MIDFGEDRAPADASARSSCARVKPAAPKAPMCRKARRRIGLWPGARVAGGCGKWVIGPLRAGCRAGGQGAAPGKRAPAGVFDYALSEPQGQHKDLPFVPRGFALSCKYARRFT